MITKYKILYRLFKYLPGIRNIVISFILFLCILTVVGVILSLVAAGKATEMEIIWRFFYVGITAAIGLFFVRFSIAGFLPNTSSWLVFFNIPFGLAFALIFYTSISYVFFNDIVMIHDAVLLDNHMDRSSLDLIESMKFRFSLMFLGQEGGIIFLILILFFSLIIVIVPVLFPILFRFSDNYKHLSTCNLIQKSVYEEN